MKFQVGDKIRNRREHEMFCSHKYAIGEILELRRARYSEEYTHYIIKWSFSKKEVPFPIEKIDSNCDFADNIVPPEKLLKEPKKRGRKGIGYIAVDNDGIPMLMFDTAKEAAEFSGATAPTIIHWAKKRKKVNGLIWMTKEYFVKIVGSGRMKNFASGVEEIKKREAKERKGKKKWKHRSLTEDELLEKLAEKEKVRLLRRKAFGSFFKGMARFHLPWMIEMKDAWIERCNFGFVPCMLADYYGDNRDKEIAVFASLFIKGVKIYEKMQFWRDRMGSHPWEWFKERGFVRLSKFKSRKPVVRYFDELWTECFSIGNYKSVWDMIRSESERDCISYNAVLARLFSGDNYLDEQQFGLFLLYLSKSPGLGRGIWDIPKNKIRIPVRGGMLSFLMTWMPDYAKYGDPNECVELFEIDDVDFYHCYLAYEDLKRVRPHECSTYATFYQKHYGCDRQPSSPYFWKHNLPKISFDYEEDCIDVR